MNRAPATWRAVGLIATLALLAWSPRAHAQAQFNVTIQPSTHLTMNAGDQQLLTVTTQANASTPPSATSVTYNLQITPDFAGGGPIYTDTPKTTSQAAGWPPVQIMITVPVGTPAGQYSGPLYGHYEYSPGNFTDYDFGVVYITVNAPAPAFSFDVNPPSANVAPGAPATLTISTHPDPGFNAPVNYSFSPSVSFLIATPQTQQVTSPAYASFPLQVAVNANDPSFHAGTYSIGVVASGGASTFNHTISVTVTAPPQDFNVNANPSSFTIPAGGQQHVSFAATGVNGFTGPVTVTAPAAPAHTTITPSVLTLTPGGAAQDFVIATDASASSATLNFSATATVNAAPSQKNVAVAMNVTPAAQPDFALSAVVLTPQVVIGGQGQIRFTASPINGFNGTIQVALQNAVPGVTMQPVTLTTASSATGTLLVDPHATAGPVNLAFTAVSGTLHHEAAGQIQLVAVNAAAPTISSVTPPGVARGATPATLRVAGTNFVNGATIFADSPSIVVHQTIVHSATLADVVVSAQPNADLRRPYMLRLRNPNGLETAQGVPLLVYDQNAIGAPLGVRAAAIVSPVEGTLVAGTDEVFARGLVATTGSGVLHGEWRVDGVAYESFEVAAQAGMPVEVRSRLRVPSLAWGDHDLTLAIAVRLDDLAPGGSTAVVSPAVRLISTIETATKLTILDPPDRVIVRTSAAPTFRWTLVPGASGYRVEIGTPESPALTTFDLSAAEWTPTRRELQRIGHGIFVWRVRALFPGGVVGEPTAQRALVILPEAVSLRLDAPREGELAWTGGSPGVLYHVEIAAADGTALFDSFTVRERYRVPRALRTRAVTARVTPVALDLRPLGASARAGLPPLFRTAAADAPGRSLTIDVAPADGSSVTTTQPTISAIWSDPVSVPDVSLFIDTTDVTPVANITSTSISYDSILPLSNGSHTARLTAGGSTKSWSFTVNADAAQPATTAAATGGNAVAPPVTIPSGPSMAATSTRRTDYTLAPNGTISWVHDGTNDGHVQLSGQGDVSDGATGTKFTGDLAWHAGMDPDTLRQESRNYVVHGSARSGGIGGEATLGYVTPDFTMGAEFLTSGLARTGGVGKVSTAIGSFAYYQPVSTAIHGVLSAEDLNLRIRSAAWTTPGQRPYQLGVIALDVKDRGSASAASEQLRTIGLMGSWTISPAAGVSAELAHGSSRSNCAFVDLDIPCTGGTRDGNAERLGIAGTAGGKTTYSVMLRHVDANFVNPANRGFTAGGVSDRTSLDLSLSRTLGRSFLSLTARRQDGGRSHESTSPRSSQTGANLNWMLQAGRHLTVNTAATWSQDRARESATFYLPRTARSLQGLNTTFSEMFGRGFMLSEALSYMETNDEVNPLTNQKVSSAMLTFSGTVMPNFTISANGGATRSDGAETLGTTNQYVASFQPMIAFPAHFVSFQPRISWNRSTNDLTSTSSSAEQYSAIVQLSPSWLGSFLSAQASADWSRSSNESFGVRYHQFTRQYQASLNLRWGGLHAGSAYVTPSLLPGAAPVDAPISQTAQGAVSH